MELKYGPPKSLSGVPFTYCAGCGHGLLQKACAEVVDELDLRERFVFAASVGCNGLGGGSFNTDAYGSLHGRATASATGFKRVNPESIVMVYQGDGDAASIGLGESIHAANRGEALTIVMANNMIYGMTGGQMSPTTLSHMPTSTTVNGRNPLETGYPLKMAELIATLDAPQLVARCSIHTPKHVMEFKKLLKEAFVAQRDQGAYSFIEVLVPCPTNMKMSPVECMEFIGKNAVQEFKLGVFKRDGKRIGEKA